jgi:hypothetical protein
VKDYNQLLHEEASGLYAGMFKGKSLSVATEAQRNTFLRTAKKELAARGVFEPDPEVDPDVDTSTHVAQAVKPDKYEWTLVGVAIWCFILGFVVSRFIR